MTHGGKRLNAGRKVGSISSKTEDWINLKDFIINEGAERYTKYLKSLNDKDFADRYEAILNYFKPKHASAQVQNEISKETIIRVVRDAPKIK